jgi:hypothetical protein
MLLAVCKIAKNIIEKFSEDAATVAMLEILQVATMETLKMYLPLPVRTFFNGKDGYRLIIKEVSPDALSNHESRK